MKKKKLYVFTKASRAAVYGVGSYLDNLKKTLEKSDFDFTFVRPFADGDEMKIVENEGYKEIIIPFPSKGTKNAFSCYYLNLPLLLKEFIPEERNTEIIFHLNFMENEALIKHLKKAFRCKILTVVHYTDWSFMLSGDFFKLKRLAQKNVKSLTEPLEKAVMANLKNNLQFLGRADKIVCVAEHTRDEFYRLNELKHKDIEIVNNALVDAYKPLSCEEKLLLRKKYHIEKDEKIIFFAGRLDEVKGVKFLLKAMDAVLLKHTGICLFIAGDGDFGNLMKEAFPYWTKITFTGKIDRKELYELYSIADMGIVCSLHEEFGYVAIEMMMHALPVIVTKTGGLDEIVEDGVSGLKVPVRTRKGVRQVDVKILSEKICLLLENPELSSEFGCSGRKRFLERFELSVFKKKMLDLYNII